MFRPVHLSLVVLLWLIQSLLALPASASENIDGLSPDNQQIYGGKGKKPAGKKTPAKKTEKKKKVNPNPPKRYNGDFFVGGAVNDVAGIMKDNHSFFYETGSDKFPTAVVYKSFNWFTAGGQFRYVPFALQPNTLSWLSVAVGAHYMKKGFSTEFSMQNFNLNYQDRTKIFESFEGQYLSVPLMLRFGNRVYLEGGFCMDFLLSDQVSYKLQRQTQGANAYEGPFTEEITTSQVQSKDVLSGFSTGWCFAFGYNFYRPFAFRFFGTINPGLLREGPNLTNSQYSLQFMYTFSGLNTKPKS